MMSMPVGVGSSNAAALGIGARTNNVSVTSINCANATTSPVATTTTTDSATTTTSPTDATNLTTTSLSSNSNSISNSNNSSNVVANDQSPSVAALNNGNHFYGNGSIRISVPKMEESDESETELSNIENTAASASSAPGSVSMRASMNKNAPRPMSWEGELSDNDDRMETENVASPTSNGTTTNDNCGNANSMADATAPVANNGNDQINVITYATNDKSSPTQRQSSSHDDNGQQPPASMPLLPKDAIKPEYVDNMPIYGNAATANKRYPIDMTSLKYEVQQTSHQYQQADAINSPLLARSKTTLLPANPSPDSAIHSVYTHSSPSQSPLTSRHTPYTPSLSRNNSDASYSSCYSYSSEFSPTHSPIQGRHNMYAGGGGGGSNFNGSPLHHSVLYKPLMEGSNGPTGDNCSKIVQQHVQEENVLEAEAIPSAGISRQQLINR